jgi:hypothetical protein
MNTKNEMMWPDEKEYRKKGQTQDEILLTSL